MKIVNWKTTLGGILAGGGQLFASQFPKWNQWGSFVSGLGLLLLGMAARDHNVSSEQSGVKFPETGAAPQNQPESKPPSP